MHSFEDGFNPHYHLKHFNFEAFTKKKKKILQDDSKKISLTLVSLGCLESQ